MSALAPTSLPAPPMTRTCRRRPCSRPAPSAQPVEAPAPRPRSGIAGLPAHCLWPELTVATGSSRSSVVHTAPGYLCPWRHGQAVKPCCGLDGHSRSASSSESARSLPAGTRGRDGDSEGDSEGDSASRLSESTFRVDSSSRLPSRLSEQKSAFRVCSLRVEFARAVRRSRSEATAHLPSTQMISFCCINISSSSSS